MYSSTLAIFSLCSPHSASTMWRSVVLLVATLVVSEGKNLTVDMELLQHWDDNWEGRFCFDLPTPIVGYELALHFSVGVKQIQVSPSLLPPPTSKTDPGKSISTSTTHRPSCGPKPPLTSVLGVKQIQVSPSLLPPPTAHRVVRNRLSLQCWESNRSR